MIPLDVQPDDQDIFSDRQVLIVEDCSSVRIILKKILVQLGVHCPLAEAQDGLEAWNILQKGSYHLVISDIAMPKLNGFELLRLMRRSEEYQSTPLLLITGAYFEEQVAAVVMPPYEDYLLKPFTPNTLAHRLRRLIKRAGFASGEEDPLPLVMSSCLGVAWRTIAIATSTLMKQHLQ